MPTPNKISNSNDGPDSTHLEMLSKLTLSEDEFMSYILVQNLMV